MQGVFVDTDVTLDLLSQRKPFYTYAAKLFSAAEKGDIKIFVSSLSFSNLNYILSKQYSTVPTREILRKLKLIVNVLSVTDKEIDLALASDFKDFEDAIQYFSAIDNGIGIIITRNLVDYQITSIPVMTAEQYIVSTS
jgi:predicted nucleic acid-binding protein